MVCSAQFRGISKRYGLRTNWLKTKTQNVGTGDTPTSLH